MLWDKLGTPTVALALSLAVLAAPNFAHAGKKERNIALGVGIGLLGGMIVSNGDPRAAIGGAVAGGLIGGATTKDKNRSWRDSDRGWRHGPPPRYHRHHGDRPRPRY